MGTFRYFQLISVRRKHDNVIIFSVIRLRFPTDKRKPPLHFWVAVINGAETEATFAYEIESKYLQWYKKKMK